VTRIASLPWYDEPAARRALDDFWSALREELGRVGVVDLPVRLDRKTALPAQWSDASLVLSQCCGLDLFTRAARALRPIGRPVFADIPGAPGSYFSYIVASERGVAEASRVAINAPSSRSGSTALLAWLAGRGLRCAQISISGSHRSSLAMLRAGRADLAAIDAHSWPLLDQRGVAIVGCSASAPAPPFVCHREVDVDAAALFAALERAVTRRGRRIGIAAVAPAGIELYEPLLREAEALGVAAFADLRSCGADGEAALVYDVRANQPGVEYVIRESNT